MTDELKPCPFCGGEAELRSWSWPYVRYQVRCSACKCQARARMASEAEAIAAWNTRQSTTSDALAAMREAREALADVLDYRLKPDVWDNANTALTRLTTAIENVKENDDA